MKHPRINPFPEEAQFRNAGWVDGKRMIRLTAPLVCVTSRGTIVVPVDFVSDGGSIPQAAWSVVGHPFGSYLEDVILHDYLYRPDSDYYGLSRIDADNLLKETFWNRREPLWKQAAFYAAVRTGGQNSYKAKIKTPMIVILDPGHGMSNRRSGRYDPGAVSNGVTEAEIVMDWTNELRGILRARGVAVVRTRVDDQDPAPVGQRAAIARRYKGDLMVSLHCNAHDGTVGGTETYYRGEAHRQLASKLNLSVVKALGTVNRGAKTEASSQHKRLAIMAFQPCFLIELGFIDHAGNRAKMLDAELRRKSCLAIADLLEPGKVIRHGAEKPSP